MKPDFLTFKSSGIIACALGILGLLFIYFNPFQYRSLNELLALIVPLNLLWTSMDSSFFHGVNVYELIGSLLLISGGIICLASKGKNLLLIRFMFSLVFLSTATSLLFALGYSIAFNTRVVWHSPLYFASAQLIHILLLAIIWNCLLWMNGQYMPYGETVIYDSFETVNYDSVDYGTRILNWITDLLIAVLLSSAHFKVIAINMSAAKFSPFFEPRLSRDAFIILFCAYRFFYYTLSESLLNITPGKVLTRTRVVDHSGAKPSFKHVLIRTLCRFIPFDSLSFFTNVGWHDKLSETRVVKELSGVKNEDQIIEVV